MTLPPLPLPGLCMDVGTGFRKWYSADQMQAYATAAVLAEREACALLCEPVAVERQDIGGPVRTFWEQPDNCATLIRARKN